MRRFWLSLFTLVCGLAWAQPSLVGLARSGSPAEVRAALAAGADVHSVDEYGQTPLFYAAESNSPEVVESLVRAGADVNARTPDGWTPLMVAFRNTAHPTMVSKLVSLGARAEGVLFETYRNETLGYTLAYPAGILEPQGEFVSGDGQSFLSRDGRARMLVFSLPRTRATLAEAFAAAAAETPGRTVTYKVLRDDWFVVSGYEDDSVFYEKTLLAGERLITTELKYHRQLQTLFNPITTRVSSSFALEAPAREEARVADTGAAAQRSDAPAPTSPPRVVSPPPEAAAPPATTPPVTPPPATPPPATTAPVDETARALEPSPAPTPSANPEAAPRPDPEPSSTQQSSPPPPATASPLPTPALSLPASPPPAPAPSPATTQFFDYAFRLTNVREVSCSAAVQADAAPGGLELRCGRKRQDAVGFKTLWDRASAGVEALEAISSWQVSGGSHRRDYRQGDSLLTIIFNDGYIINEAEIILYRRPAR